MKVAKQGRREAKQVEMYNYIEGKRLTGVKQRGKAQKRVARDAAFCQCVTKTADKQTKERACENKRDNFRQQKPSD